jgi:peptide/nickel transport system ATP-binding protein
MTEPLMSLKNLTRTFDTRGGKITAVDNVSFDLHKGDILCLVGESGSGKTTVARMASGMLKPSAGQVLFEGKDIHAMGKDDFGKYRRAVQIIHQDPYASLNPVQTIGEIIRAPLIHHKMVKGRREATQRVAELLELVDLSPAENFIEKYPHQLSGGQRQRVSIARACSTPCSSFVMSWVSPSSLLPTTCRLLNTSAGKARSASCTSGNLSSAGAPPT